MDALESFEKRIREIRPGLAIESLSINREGLLNDVVIVNSELVFRFAKRDYGFKDLLEEARVLQFLRSHVTLRIPEPGDKLVRRIILKPLLSRLPGSKTIFETRSLLRWRDRTALVTDGDRTK